MGRIRWRYNSFFLLRVKKGRFRLFIPLPLSLLQDVVEAVSGIVYWVFRLWPEKRKKVARKIEKSSFSSEDILTLLKMPSEFFRELRKTGPLVLLKVQTEEIEIEMRLI